LRDRLLGPCHTWFLSLSLWLISLRGILQKLHELSGRQENHWKLMKEWPKIVFWCCNNSLEKKSTCVSISPPIWDLFQSGRTLSLEYQCLLPPLSLCFKIRNVPLPNWRI
jgi:hypothetical protein